jgi:uncharacterized damage-inducible protein DinB
MEDAIRYPIGSFHFHNATPEMRQDCIRKLEESPRLLREAVSGLNEHQLLNRYRSGGWTLAQVVHHLAEADVNAYPRMKYALTEDVPNVMVAQEALWAELADAKASLIEPALALFETIRYRWVIAWRSLKEEDFSIKWKHAHFGVVPLDHMLQQYAWHGLHHIAQITSYRTIMNW